MKKAALILLLIVIIAGCQHSNNPTPSQTTTPPSNTVTLTHADSVLLGYWVLDTKTKIMNGTVMSGYPQSFHDSTNCMIQFLTTTWTSTPNGQGWMNCNDGVTITSCVISPTLWVALSSTMVNINNMNHIIVSISPTNLVLQYGSTNSPGTSGTIYYLHKAH